MDHKIPSRSRQSYYDVGLDLNGSFVRTVDDLLRQKPMAISGKPKAAGLARDRNAWVCPSSRREEPIADGPTLRREADALQA